MEEKKGFFKRLVAGLTKTRDNIVSGIDAIFRGFSSIDDDFYDEIEEILVMGDLGINATTAIIEELKRQVKEKNIKEPSACKQLLIDSIKQQMNVGETAYEFEKRKSAVSGDRRQRSGKDHQRRETGRQAYRPGEKSDSGRGGYLPRRSGRQLTGMGQTGGVDIIGGQEGSDPGSVVYDAIAAAKARNADVLLIDTAGRLHNKKNLMNELGKINRILEREYPGSLPGNSGGPGRHDGTERSGSGQGIQGGRGYYRDYPHEAGRHGQRRHCGGDPFGAWHSREIHRRRRID